MFKWLKDMFMGDSFKIKERKKIVIKSEPKKSKVYNDFQKIIHKDLDHLKYLFFFLFEKENRPCDTFAEFKSLANGYPSQFTFNYFSESRIGREPGIHLTATSTVLRKQYKDHNEFDVGYDNLEVGYKNLSGWLKIWKNGDSNINFKIYNSDLRKFNSGTKIKHQPYGTILKNGIELTKIDKKKVKWILGNIDKDYFDIDGYMKDEKRKFQNFKNVKLKKFDKDKNETIDIVDDKNVFEDLLKKHQKDIIEKGKEFNQSYIHQFVKINHYLNDKRKNLKNVFHIINKIDDRKEFNKYLKILNEDIYCYHLLVFNSLNMMVYLIEDNQLLFYEIYERFDKLKIFNSNWENEVSKKLNDINLSLMDLMNQIQKVGGEIIQSINDLSFVTKESTKILDSRLEEINSSVKTNNFLTLINTYLNYKTSKNTKPRKK